MARLRLPTAKELSVAGLTVGVISVLEYLRRRALPHPSPIANEPEEKTPTEDVETPEQETILKVQPEEESVPLSSPSAGVLKEPNEERTAPCALDTAELMQTKAAQEDSTSTYMAPSDLDVAVARETTVAEAVELKEHLEPVKVETEAKKEVDVASCGTESTEEVKEQPKEEEAPPREEKEEKFEEGQSQTEEPSEEKLQLSEEKEENEAGAQHEPEKAEEPEEPEEPKKAEPEAQEQPEEPEAHEQPKESEAQVEQVEPEREEEPEAHEEPEKEEKPEAQEQPEKEEEPEAQEQPEKEEVQEQPEKEEEPKKEETKPSEEDPHTKEEETLLETKEQPTKNEEPQKELFPKRSLQETCALLQEQASEVKHPDPVAPPVAKVAPLMMRAASDQDMTRESERGITRESEQAMTRESESSPALARQSLPLRTRTFTKPKRGIMGPLLKQKRSSRNWLKRSVTKNWLKRFFRLTPNLNVSWVAQKGASTHHVEKVSMLLHPAACRKELKRREMEAVVEDSPMEQKMALVSEAMVREGASKGPLEFSLMLSDGKGQRCMTVRAADSVAKDQWLKYVEQALLAHWEGLQLKSEREWKRKEEEKEK